MHTIIDREHTVNNIAYWIADKRVIDYGSTTDIDALVSVLTNGRVQAWNSSREYHHDQHAVTWFCKRRADERIVGMGALHRVHTMTHSYGVVHDVATLPEVQGQGIGRAIMQVIIDQARLEGLVRLELTSRPTRVAANTLYRSLGFEQPETNYYRLPLAEKT